MPATQTIDDPFDTPEYHQFVSEMSRYCRCSSPHNPCDSVLAGGPCEQRDHDEMSFEYEDDSDDWN